MSSTFSDRDLLYGILAVQMCLVDRSQLVQAIQQCVSNGDKSLGQALVEGGVLAAKAKPALDRAVEEHLAQHSHDAAKSLATLSGVDSLEDELRTIGSADVNATLAHLSTTVVARGNRDGGVADLTAESNRYRIVREHAKGGIGQVSVAVDNELSREVALKELQARFADDEETRARFVLEAEVTGGLEHPGVVPVYGLGRYADGRPFYTMRFVRGDSLLDATQRFHSSFNKQSGDSGFDLELRKLLRRFIDVCNAMEYAHSRGVLHRDLKPGNVMLGNYGETLVVDWGLAKVGNEPSRREAAIDESKLFPASASDSAPTQLGSTVGTPHYMSPEQAAGKIDELNITSDVYSLGATLYHILTGEPPYQGTDIGVVLAAVQTGIVRPPRTVNPRIAKPLEAICLKAMSLQSADRYPTARMLADDVDRWLADEPTEALPDSGLRSIQRWTRRHRGFTFATAAGLLLVSVVSAFSYLAVSAQRDEARKQRDRAVTSEAEAQENFEAAEQARALAVRQEKRAARVAYNSTLSEAAAMLGEDPMMARFLLEDEVRCPIDERDFVWHTLMQQLTREEHALPLTHSRTGALCYSPDGELLVTGGEGRGEVWVWKSSSGERVATLSTDLPAVHQLLFSPDGKTLACLFETYSDDTPWSQNLDVQLELWDIGTKEKRLARQRSLPQNSMLSVTDDGFSIHSFTSEYEYSQQNPEYLQRHEQAVNDAGQLVNRWHRWMSYYVQSDEETTKFIRVDEDVNIAEGFFVQGKWLSSPCHTDDGEYLWLHDLSNDVSKTVRLGPPVSNKTSLFVSANDSTVFLLGMEYVEESVSDIDSMAYLETVEFDVDVAFQQVNLGASENSPNVPLGRIHSGVFVEDERSQFLSTDRRGETLAIALEARPVVQLVDVNQPDKARWIPAHRGDVVSLALSPDGNQLATVGLDRVLRLWSVPSINNSAASITTEVERARRLLLTPDGEQLLLLGLGPDAFQGDIDYSQPLSGDEELPSEPFFQAERFRLNDLASQGLRDFQDPTQLKSTDGKNVLGIFGSFGDVIGDAVASSFLANPVQNQLTQAVLSADATELVLAGPSRLLQFNLQMGAGEERWGEYHPNLKQPIQIRRIVMSDDLKFFAVMQEKDRSIRVYDYASREPLWQVPSRPGEAGELLFLPSSHTLLVMRDLPDDASGSRSECEFVNVDARTSRQISLPRLQAPQTLHVSKNRKKLVIFQQYDREVLVVDAESGEIVSQVNVVRETPGGLLPDSDLLMLFGETGELKLWDTHLDQYRATLQVFDDQPIASAQLSRDRNTLVVLGEQGSIRCFGADRLLDDLADIHHLWHEPLIASQPNAQRKQEPTAVASESPARIEVLDELPELQTDTSAESNDDSVPLPPAPTPPAPVPVE